MCRALLYLGEPVLLDNLLFQPDSALVRQSYMPKMLHMLNLAGFGMRAWDPASRDPAAPFAYASDSLPVFDRNLKSLAAKVAADCVLAHVRGVAYNTLVLSQLEEPHLPVPGTALVAAVKRALAILREERAKLGIDTSSSVNLFVADGRQVVAVRYCFDFGRYATTDATRLHEANLGF